MASPVDPGGTTDAATQPPLPDRASDNRLLLLPNTVGHHEYGEDDAIARAFDMGAAYYLVKPFSPTDSIGSEVLYLMRTVTVVLAVANVLILTLAGMWAFGAGNTGYPNYGPSGPVVHTVNPDGTSVQASRIEVPKARSGWGWKVPAPVVIYVCLVLASGITGLTLAAASFVADGRGRVRRVWTMVGLFLFAIIVAFAAFVWSLTVSLSFLM